MLFYALLQMLEGWCVTFFTGNWFGLFNTLHVLGQFFAMGFLFYAIGQHADFSPVTRSRQQRLAFLRIAQRIQ